MKVINEELFFCYAWDDLADVTKIIAEWNYELGVEITTPLETGNENDVDESIYDRLTNADIFVLFMSDVSKDNGFVKNCVVRARNLNKNIIPIQIGKSSLFSSMPAEFKFRGDVYEYGKQDSKAKLFAQLKAALGVSVCSGDSYGRLFHIVTDADVVVIRYGQELGMASRDSDFQIRLVKGSHMLEFKSVVYSGVSVFQEFDVKSNEGEDFIKVAIKEKLDKEKEMRENEKAERKIRKQYEERRIRMEEEQKDELMRQQNAIKQQTEEPKVEYVGTSDNDAGANGILKGCSSPGCFLVISVVLGVALPWTLFISIPVLIYMFVKRGS